MHRLLNLPVKKLLILIFSSLIFSCVLFSQTDDSLYFPLEVGNKWVFETVFSGGSPGSTFRFAARITGETLIRGRQYFIFNNFISPDGISYIRYDAGSGFLVKYDTLAGNCNSEIRLFKLDATLGDTINTDCRSMNYTCNLIQDTVLFRTQTTLKSVGYDHSGEYGISIGNWEFLKNIGFYHSFSAGGHNIVITAVTSLKGYLINGIVYGDTSTANYPAIHNPVINTFSLYQNYPNPFNPKTSITFDLSVEGLIKISVYDVKGQKLEDLTSDFYTPGHYKLEWDGTNYSSGVYFYKMEAFNFTIAKKMFLIK